MQIVERRRATRYALRFPIETTRIGGEPASVRGLAENISSRAVLFTSPSPIPVGQRVEFKVEMLHVRGARMSLKCGGNIVRMEMREYGACAVVATIERHEYMRS
jgi:PilZ domain